MKPQHTNETVPLFRSIEDLYTSAETTLMSFNTWAKSLLFAAAADHIGFKCSSAQEFEQIRAWLEPTALWIHQSMISGRRVAYIKIPQPIPSYLGDIWYLELSDQKPDGGQKRGFDHIEIFPAHTALSYMIEMLNNRGFALVSSNHAHHPTFDIILENGFKVRLEPEALVFKIQKELV